MFFYLPFFMFAGAMLYAFPELALWLGSVYFTALLWSRFCWVLRNRRPFG